MLDVCFCVVKQQCCTVVRVLCLRRAKLWYCHLCSVLTIKSAAVSLVFVLRSKSAVVCGTAIRAIYIYKACVCVCVCVFVCGEYEYEFEHECEYEYEFD